MKTNLLRNKKINIGKNAAVLEKSANEHVLKMKAYKSNNVSLTNQSCASKLNGIMFMLLRLLQC